jgi:hypothetical protein
LFFHVSLLGIYIAPDACKSHDYTKPFKKVRALVLCRVAVGNCHKVYEDEHFTAPPQGYDSILGEPGGSLNYPECVLFDEAAICPSYVVLYKKFG